MCAVILCLGDSLTAGYGVMSSAAYPALLQNRLQQGGYHHRVINAGVSGDTSADGLRRLPGLLLRHQPSIAIVALGANDGLCRLDLQKMSHNLAEIMDQLQAAGVVPILAGMRIPAGGNRHYQQRFAAIYAELAQEKGVARIPFFLQHVANDPTLNQGDGIHPNAAGYGIVLENVWSVLESRLVT